MVKCEFTSEWDDGSVVTTYCEYNHETGFVDPDVSNTLPEGSLVREYITLNSGEELEVCPNCHSYVLNKDGECLGADPDCTRMDGE